MRSRLRASDRAMARMSPISFVFVLGVMTMALSIVRRHLFCARGFRRHFFPLVGFLMFRAFPMLSFVLVKGSLAVPVLCILLF